MLHAIDNDAVARLYALEGYALGPNALTKLHFAIGDLVAFAHDIDEFLALIEAQRPFRDEQLSAFRAVCQPDGNKHPGDERAVCIIELGAGANGAAGRIDSVVETINITLIDMPFVALHRKLNRN